MSISKVLPEKGSDFVDFLWEAEQLLIGRQATAVGFGCFLGIKTVTTNCIYTF